MILCGPSDVEDGLSEHRDAPGEVTEWSKVHDWKSCVRKRTAGSNPALSADIPLALFCAWRRRDSREFPGFLREPIQEGLSGPDGAEGGSSLIQIEKVSVDP